MTLTLKVEIADGFSKLLDIRAVQEDLQRDAEVCAAMRQVRLMQKAVPEIPLFSEGVTGAAHGLLLALARFDAALLAPRTPTDPKRQQDNAPNLTAGRPEQPTEPAAAQERHALTG